MEDPFKGIVHPKMIPQFTGTHPQAIVVYDFISFPGEPVKIELIQLIPPGTPAIISQISLHESFCRLLTTNLYLLFIALLQLEKYWPVLKKTPEVFFSQSQSWSHLSLE